MFEREPGLKCGVDFKVGYSPERINPGYKLLGSCKERISSQDWTESFCCVCDIPLKYLDFHRKYYGDVAVGFNAISIQKQFNPVLYIDLENAPLIDDSRKLDLNKTFSDNDPAEAVLEYVLGLNKETYGTLSNFMKRTRFSLDRDESFYGEREWRHLGDFNFANKDIDLILIPEQLKQDLKDFLNKNEIQATTILTWELIEKL